MILVIDTSSSRSALGVIDRARRHRFDALFASRGDPVSLASRLTDVIKDPSAVTKIAVAIGPGSFTGLRKGVSFGLGLAIGLRVPIVALPTLDLQAARGRGRFTAVVEAGRGRFYFQVPGGRPELGGPDTIPREVQLVGLVLSATEAALRESGLEFAGYREVRTVAEAAEELLETAPEVPYRKLEIEYMQTFSARKG